MSRDHGDLANGFVVYVTKSRGVTMANSGYFDIKKDIEIEKAGGFFCSACLVGKPLDDISPDPRYCQGCYDVLLKEAELLPPKNRPSCLPKPPKGKKVEAEDNIVTPSLKAGLKIKRNEINIRHILPVGRPSLGLPEDYLMELAAQGLGYRAIAKRLQAEGIEGSHMAVGRAIKKLQGRLLV